MRKKDEEEEEKGALNVCELIKYAKIKMRICGVLFKRKDKLKYGITANLSRD